jgi:predicted enzyme related to lactoylglutathione lyase
MMMPQTATESRAETHTQIHGKFIWCELMTPDTRAAGEFYASVIGWNVKELKMDGMPSYFLFEMGEGDKCPGIGGMMNFPPELEGKVPPNWTGYVAVDDVDETAKQFAALGGSVRRAPENIPGIGRFAVVADPHGAVICIMTPLPPENPPQQLPPEPPGNVGWYELYAGDCEEAFQFYAQVFGWTVDHDMDMGPTGVYRIFAHRGRVIGGMMTRPPNVPIACWGYYFNVDAIDAAIDRLTAGGGNVVHGPMEVPGGSWIVQATDPQGAFFSLVGPKT